MLSEVAPIFCACACKPASCCCASCRAGFSSVANECIALISACLAAICARRPATRLIVARAWLSN